MSKSYFFYFYLFCLCIFFACKSDYTKYVERELDKGVNNDSLIFDMKIGQTQKEFFEMCWNLNKQKLVDQGTGAKSVKYLEPIIDSLNPGIYRKEMLFFGIFDEQKIMQGMDISFNYVSWAPWNKQLQSDSLLLDVKKKILREYPGNDFMEIDIKELKIKAYAKIDGNRQILLYRKNDKDVVVKIENLNYKYKKK